MKEKIAHIIRIITVPPVMASALILIYAVNGRIFTTAAEIIEGFAFLVVIPISAYPFCRVVPKLHEGGRETQRKTAFVFSLIGYVVAVLFALLTGKSAGLVFIYLTYLLSGILLTFTNKVIKIKASGHACSMIWPILVGCYFCPLSIIIGAPLYGTVLWSSVKTGRHTAKEFICGSLVCLISAGLSAVICLSPLSLP